jgi:hypothetical protein
VSWTLYIQILFLILLCGLLIHDFIETWWKHK